MLLLQFLSGVIVTLEKAQHGHVNQGVGGRVKLVGDRKVLSFVVNRAQIFYETVSESTLGLTNVEEATSGAADTGDQVDGCTDEPLSDMKGLPWALDGVTRDGDGEVQGEGDIRDGPGEFEVGVRGVSKVDELFNLLMGARGSANTVINVAEEEVRHMVLGGVQYVQ
eukprot:g36020.t1